MQLAGLASVRILDFPDGGLHFTEEAVGQARREMERLQITHLFAFSGTAHSVRSDDHRQAGLIAMAALRAYLADRAGERVPVYRFSTSRPNLVVNITDTFDSKLKLLGQFSDFSGWRAPMIRSLQEGMAESYGRLIGVKYGEGFEKENAAGSSQP